MPSMVVSMFDPDEPYDPNRPNDLGEYRAYRKRLREEKRAKALAERERRARGESSESGSSYYSSSEEEAPRRDGQSAGHRLVALLTCSAQNVCPSEDILSASRLCKFASCTGAAGQKRRER